MAYCLNCGEVAPDKTSEAGISSYDYTVASSPYAMPLQAPPPPPPTSYGSPTYGAPTQNPYQPLNPYDPYTPPMPPPRRKGKIGLIIGIVVLVLILVSIGIFAAFGSLAKNNPPGKAATTPTITDPLTATSLAITATATNNPYPPNKGTLVLDDPLRDNSQGYSWQVSNNNPYSCAFTNGAYDIKTEAGYFNPCVANITNFANFAYEVQMTIIAGDCGAILFRVDKTNTGFYYFRICQDGTFALFLYTNNKGTNLADSTNNSAIRTGLNQPNLIAVVAQSDTLDLYANHQHLYSISDTTYSQGRIGVVADGFPGHHSTEVQYSNAKLWKL
jgi:hypothetical protein